MTTGLAIMAGALAAFLTALALVVYQTWDAAGED
jgi:hypothetical protein